MAAERRRYKLEETVLMLASAGIEFYTSFPSGGHFNVTVGGDHAEQDLSNAQLQVLTELGARLERGGLFTIGGTL